MNWFSIAWAFIKGVFGGASASDTKLMQEEAEQKGAFENEADNAREAENSVADANAVDDSVAGMPDADVADKLRGWTLHDHSS